MEKIASQQSDVLSNTFAIRNSQTANERIGDWIQTYSGRQFWPLDPRLEDVDIIDIAHSLSNMCRFAGHVKKFYSVAEHCVRVSYVCDPQFALWGLLHDASEAYLVDLPRPIKHSGALDAYKAFEKDVQDVICERFGLPKTEPPNVKEADTILLLTEQRDLMGRQTKPWKDKATPLDTVILPLNPEQAELEFMIRFKELTGKVN
jgi:5'-deoxynucleotidase YfbR-like HD superfamily hydrolase